MRRPHARRPKSESAGLFALLGLAASCSAHSLPSPIDPIPRRDLSLGQARPALRPSAPPPSAPGPRRVPLGEARSIPLALSIEPVQGAQSVLLVSQFAGERTAWVRRLDGRTGDTGPLIELTDEHVHSSFDGSDGRFTLVTSDGVRLCLATYRPDADRPDARGCAAVSPSSIAAVDDRLALLELSSFGPRPAAKVAKATLSAPRDKKSPRTDRVKKGARPLGGAKKKKKASHTALLAARPPPKVPVELRIRWATRAGEFEPEAKPTGLRFEAPLDGMELVDARGRPPGIDLAWFETAPKRKTRSPLGSARLMAASLRADGSLDPTSRVSVIDGDLEYGLIHDHRAPRLVGSSVGSAYIGLDARGQCEAARVRPAFVRLTPSAALCSIDPDRLAASPPASGADLAVLEKILAEAPQRTSGQPRRDLGLVAWAGDRAYFLRDGALRSASRAEGSPRDEPPPFTARRSRIAWGAIADNGEAIALTGEGLVHLDPLDAPVLAAPPGDAPEARDSAALPALGRAPDLPVDRRRAARIGRTFWIARGDVVRVFPDVAAPPLLRGIAPVDASALVGGAAHGILLEVAGSALRLTAIDASGDAAPLGGPEGVSPVRVGFDACERAGGGALVAGVSASDASRVIAFAVDAEGHVGAERSTSLPIRPGELGVRLTPLPGGGALLTDLERRHVVWLDDAARPLASAPAPRDESAALCVDGRPARLQVAAPTPGKFTAIADFAAPGTCIVGEPVWLSGGALMWLGSTVKGLDAIAEARIGQSLEPLSLVSGPAPFAPIPSLIEPDPSRRLAPSPECPSEMVSIGGRFCVDRFEAMILDATTGEILSPDFPTTPNLLDFAFGEWATARARTGSVHARAFPLPFVSPSRLGRRTAPLAISRLGARPNGYLTGLVAESACAAAGKRLCSLDEFVTACRGEDDTAFPYGDTYEDGSCNVYRDEHPAAILHDNASLGHLDPRLNRVSARGKPLYQRTGESPACKSRWGGDAAYDMNGNLDEWVEEGNGAFAGGFYARATRAGCDALVTAHPRTYLDYSTGVRCCKDAAGVSKVSP
jgi:hypothetical protein